MPSTTKSSAYADARIMPTLMANALVAAVAVSLLSA
jgi:hypothetical protein